MVMLVLFKLAQVLKVPVLVILAMLTCVVSVCVHVHECLLLTGPWVIGLWQPCLYEVTRFISS